MNKLNLPIEKHFTYFHSIDILRGIASLIVVIFHVGLFTTNSGDLLPDSSILKHIASFGHYGVELFFIISGFVIPYSLLNGNLGIKNIFKFLKRRLIRIEIPYLTSIVFVFSLGFLGYIITSDSAKIVEFDIFQILSHFFYLNTFTGQKWLNDVYWTLAIEFQFYLLVGLIINFLNKKVTALPVLFIFFFSKYFILNEAIIFYYSDLFLSGIILALYFKGIFSKKEFFFLYSTLIVFYIFENPIYILFSSIFCVIILKFPTLKISLLTNLGKISYSLYLVHFPLTIRILNLLVNENNSKFKYVIFFFTIAINIGVAIAFYYFVEKPSQLLARNQKL